MMMWQSCNEDNDKAGHCLVYKKTVKKRKQPTWRGSDEFRSI